MIFMLEQLLYFWMATWPFWIAAVATAMSRSRLRNPLVSMICAALVIYGISNVIWLAGEGRRKAINDFFYDYPWLAPLAILFKFILAVAAIYTVFYLNRRDRVHRDGQN